MRRVLLFVCLLALAVAIAFLLRGSRTAALPAADAPSTPVQAAGTGSVEDTTTPGPTREAQPGVPGSSSATPGNARVHGRVLLADTRAPVGGAPVVVLYREASDPATSSKTSLAESAPDGRYSASVPDGALLVEARVLRRAPVEGKPGFSAYFIDAYESLSQDLELRLLQGDLELDLLLDSGTTLSGVVLQASDRQPIAGAEVRFESSRRTAFATTSGADGRFTIRGIKYGVPDPFAGRLGRLTATHADFVRTEQPLGALDESGNWPDATLLLERGLTVGGIVLDSAGEPVSGLELALRPMHGSPQAGLCELEGEWTTTSDTHGIFRFENVPVFDRAWLVNARKPAPTLVPGVALGMWYGASRTLLRGKDLGLPSLDIHLPIEVAVEIDVLYPDGKLANHGERLLLREEEDGRLRAAGEDGQFVCVAGRATRVVAWGRSHFGDGHDVIYRGETIVTAGTSGADPHAEIRLAPTTYERREPIRGERSLTRGAGSWANTAITLQFVDRASGAPISGERLLGIEEEGNSITSQIGKEATVRFYYEPGWETLKLTVEGYRAYTIELDVKDNEPQTLTLPLDRLP